MWLWFRLADQQISPSYNGHRVTIKVNRSNEAIAHNYNNQVVSTEYFKVQLRVSLTCYQVTK